MSSSPPTVILGAGIMGVATAYYLSQHDPTSEIHIVEASPELFSSASGFAGGFLAKDWFSPALAELGALSFEEHRRLAEEFGGREKWGYSPAEAVRYAASKSNDGDEAKRGDDWLRDGTSRANAGPPVVLGVDDEQAPVWIPRREGDHLELISEAGSTAQVDPLLLCRFLLEEGVKRGVTVHQPAKVTGVVREVMDGMLSGVAVRDVRTGEEKMVDCARLVITAGSWSGKVFEELFPMSRLKIPIQSLAGHSLVVKSPRWHKAVEGKGCHAVFTTHEQAFCPEMFSRLGGHVYFAGLNSSTLPVPDAEEGKAMPDAGDLVSLRTAAADILGTGLEIVREGLCFRPVTAWGTPIVSRIPDQDLGGNITTKGAAEGGVFLAAGHGPWGIAQSLGTGLVLAEMVTGRKTSADVSSLAFGSDTMAALD
ncbi:FAD dependent oxidoreductase [Podospora australis]|uniref:FAD dependent oxidoreductase n=1 Tax=Podospora australis TaxID=1536484 RepID=A0AAN6WX16_9PEZI|nr:FAD dependent oxidoreductase [Podospora australis]